MAGGRAAISQRAWARELGISHQSISQAAREGKVKLDADGRINPDLATNHAWAAHAGERKRDALSPAARLDAAGAKLRGLEYDVVVRRSYYCERELAARWLHRLADEYLRELTAFPGELYAALLSFGRPDGFLPIVCKHLAEHIAEGGDPHAAVETALDGAAARWRGHRPELQGREAPKVPAWVPPRTIREAQRRHAAATAAIEDMKIKVRSGELLADWPARLAVGDLVLAWRNSLRENFAVRRVATILAEARIPVTHESQWLFFRQIETVMASLIERVEFETSEIRPRRFAATAEISSPLRDDRG